MKSIISTAQLEQYRRDGFLVVDGFYDEGELERLRSAVDDSVERRLAVVRASKALRPWPARVKTRVAALVGLSRANRIAASVRAVLGKKRLPEGLDPAYAGFNWGLLNTNQREEEGYCAQVYTQCLRLSAESETLRALVLDRRLGEAVACLAGIDGVRLYHDQALFKQPFGNPTALHLDNPYWSFKSQRALTMWVALDDTTLANGCLWYLPGSHLSATHGKAVHIGEDFAGLLKLYPEWRSIEPVACPCKAGSVVFHSGMTAHGAGVNLSTRVRRAFACAFMPDGATFNGKQDVLPDDYFKSLQPGALLNRESLHPLIWSRQQG